MNQELNKKRGVLLVLIGGICWGFSGACGEYIVNHKGLDVNILIPYRLFIAGVLTLVYCAIRKIKLDLGIFTNKYHLARLLAFSLFGIFLCQYFYFYGISLSNAAIATVIQYTAPVFVILIVCAEEKRMPNIFENLALLCVIIGAVLLATNGDFSKLIITPYALFICFLASFGSVGYSIIPRKINKIYSPLPVLGYAMLICGAIFCLEERIWTKSFDMDLDLFFAMFSVIVLGTVVAFGTYMVGLNIIGASKAIIIAAIEPIGAAVIAYYWLGTELYFVQVIGFALIILAILLTIVKKEKN